MLRIKTSLDENRLNLIFFLGIILRVIVFVFQGPANNDDHLAYVQYISQHHSLPVSGLLYQSNHPPLYYCLASVRLPLGIKAVQALSLAFSIGTLWVIYLLIKKLEFIVPKAKPFCLLFACTLPQFIMFGNYISNDSLAFFIGALIFFQIYRLLVRPTFLNQGILAALLGIGLAVKGTFLLFIPALILLVVSVNRGRKLSLKQSLFSLLVFIFIFTGLGAGKGINNLAHFGRPVVIMDKDLEWVKYQGPVNNGLKSLYDINVFKLAKYPVLSEQTKHSYPLMIFGSFWYQYIPESDFKANLTGAKYLGSAIYLLALLPTFLFLLGFFRIVLSLKDLFASPGRVYPVRPAYEAAALLILLLNSLVFVIFGWRYNVYSAFQGRFLFPSFFSFILLLNSGLIFLEARPRIWRRAVYPLIACLYLLFVAYFGVEIFNKLL